MAHPIFGAIEWPSWRPEAKDLAAALLRLYQSFDAIRLVYEEHGPLEPLGNGLPRAVWDQALKNLTKAGKIEAFCDALRRGDYKDSAAFQKVVKAVIDAPSDVDKVVVGEQGNIFVIDRDKFRDHLGVLMSRGPIGVLVVRGEPDSGKSHGHWLFEAAAREVGAKIAYIDKDTATTLDLLIYNLFSTLGALEALPDTPLTTLPAWHQNVCLRLLNAAVRLDRHLWIAVDDLGHDAAGDTLTDTDVLDFCVQLARNMMSPQFQDRFRLMLIHLPDIHAPWLEQIAKFDETHADDIGEAQLVDFLSRWSKHRNKRILDAKLVEYAQDVLAEAEAVAAAVPPGQDPPPRLERLYKALTLKTQRLEAS